MHGDAAHGFYPLYEPLRVNVGNVATIAARRRARAMPTLEEAAAAVLEQERYGWRNAKHAKNWPTSLRLYVFPQLGDKPVSEITSADLRQVLPPIWRAKPETARRVRQRIGAVMKWAVAMRRPP